MNRVESAFCRRLNKASVSQSVGVGEGANVLESTAAGARRVAAPAPPRAAVVRAYRSRLSSCGSTSSVVSRLFDETTDDARRLVAHVRRNTHTRASTTQLLQLRRPRRVCVQI